MNRHNLVAKAFNERGLMCQERSMKISPRQLVTGNRQLTIGDSRDNADDSRFFGTIKRQDILGNGIYNYWEKRKAGLTWILDRVVSCELRAIASRRQTKNL